MVLPALAASVAAVYAVGKSYDSIKYWSDYHKNTGYNPKYPFRSGSMDWMGYSAGVGYGFSRKPRNITNRNHYHYHYHYR